ncbi:di-heme oxidoredictase family protein [Nitrincola sp.]|uniref:di-heme oxidoreductase family protein n=1 Tax=Nitrincola sp. TaxID=1926584 RepID=UPI003A923130
MSQQRLNTLGFSLLLAASTAAGNTPVYQTSELQPAGEATAQVARNEKAFSHPSALLADSEQMMFTLGRSLFKKIWVSAPASTKASDGLGPLFNSRSCLRCHTNNGRGHTPDTSQDNYNAVSMLLRLSIPAQNDQDRHALDSGQSGVIPEPTYGTQLQDFSIQGIPAEGRFTLSYDEIPFHFADGETLTLRQPNYSITDLKYGPLHPDTQLSPRIAPQMIGLGLLEAISDEDILAWEDPNDQNGDGISGKANRVWDIDAQATAIGRFGWKAGHPTIKQQNNSAFHEDIGISTSMYPQGYGGCTEQQTLCRQAPDGNSPHLDNVEASDAVVSALQLYIQHLAVPARSSTQAPEVAEGREQFYALGCNACHRPSYITAADAPAGLANQKIWPYTDLLLHDMGEGLADHRAEFNANGNEWRTPPLWGIGLTQATSGQTHFLHDGRARSLTEAILWHGGEAQIARNRFTQLDKPQRDALISFLESL